MPQTRPDTPFNENGVCNACITVENKNEIDWQSREQEFIGLVNKYKTNQYYDCVIPVSGGKDSTYQVLKVDEYGLNPLLVCFETTLPTEVGEHNLEAMRSIGVDLIHIKRNPVVFKKLTYKAFRYLGSAQWPMFLGAYCAPIRIAVQMNIPLVIWGENPQMEYGGQETDAKKSELDEYWVNNLGGLNDKTAKDMLDDDISMKDMVMYQYPSLDEIKTLGLKSVFLGYYFEWDQYKQMDIIKTIGWKERDSFSESTYTAFAGIDCDALEIHNYLKYVKFGYGRATDDASIDIRNNKITRDDGLQLAQCYDGKVPHIARRRFIEYLEISEQEYDSVIDSWTNKDIFLTDSSGNFVHRRDGSLVKR